MLGHRPAVIDLGPGAILEKDQAGDQLVAKAAALLLPETQVDLPPQPERRLDLPGSRDGEPAGELRAEALLWLCYVRQAQNRMAAAVL